MFLTIIVRVKKINIPHQDKVIRLPPTIGLLLWRNHLL
jgi:hypothetical protein